MEERFHSRAIFSASCQVIPGGVNSPARAGKGVMDIPLVVARGKGDEVWDVDGNRFIDYCGSWGALILGHCPPAVIQAVTEQLQRGSSFGMVTAVEQQLATEICQAFPSIDKVRFCSSGTEAVMSALRLARGVTGKSLIVKFDGHYHGHLDPLLVRAGSGVTQLAEGSSKGVGPNVVHQTLSLPFNDDTQVREILRSQENFAAVILEPIAGNMGVVPATASFLQMLREETTRKGALLIFDEVITGFRVGWPGAQKIYGVEPDLTCLGKVVGGGYPAAAFGGRSVFMDQLAPLGEVYHAGTLSGNPIAMVAGLTTLKELKKGGCYEELERKTEMLLGPVRCAIEEKKIAACIHQVGSMFTIFLGKNQINGAALLDMELYRSFHTYLFERGVYFPPSPYESCFVSLAHTSEHLHQTQKIILDALSSSLIGMSTNSAPVESVMRPG